MKKVVAYLLLTAIVLISAFGLNGCGYEYQNPELLRDYTDHNLAGTTLNVYNWGEYISDGSEGSMDVVKEFEKLTGIKVNYSTFDSNESMYSLINYGAVSYDIVIPSDYMIERMISEDLLQKIDVSKLRNYHYVDEKYKNTHYDPNNEYSVPYCVGMVGLIYNTKILKETPDSWGIMWDEKYKNDILTFNNPRDAFAIAQFLLGHDINTSNPDEWREAAELLKKQKSVLQAYVMDEVYNKMESGSAAIAPYYAGDFISMSDINEDLAFVYPKEGTNFFVDAVCIPKNAENYEAAMLFIDYLLEPEIALANAEFIYYASPNTGVTNNPAYIFNDSECPEYEYRHILYPDETELPKAQDYWDMSKETRKLFDELWQDVKLYRSTR